MPVRANGRVQEATQTPASGPEKAPASPASGTEEATQTVSWRTPSPSRGTDAPAFDPDEPPEGPPPPMTDSQRAWYREMCGRVEERDLELKKFARQVRRERL
jgi:hypothetical protein